MNRRIQFAPGEYYHLYNRGVEKREIFTDDADRERFLTLLYLSNNKTPFVMRDLYDAGYHAEDLYDVHREPIVAIGAYCLMDNHFHILVKEVSEGGITTFMKRLMTGYTMYFNRKHKRVGPLFQGTFKAEHAADDDYLKYLYAYIHLNPAKMKHADWRTKGGIADAVKDYRFSSFLDYQMPDSRRSSRIMDKAEFPEYFSDVEQFVEYHDEWLDFNRGSTSVGSSTEVEPLAAA